MARLTPTYQAAPLPLLPRDWQEWRLEHMKTPCGGSLAEHVKLHPLQANQVTGHIFSIYRHKQPAFLLSPLFLYSRKNKTSNKKQTVKPQTTIKQHLQ